MTFALFYDTETTGLPLFDQPSDDPRQPHIVQLAAVMVELETKKPVQSMNVIIRPDSWDIPEEVSRIHGITKDVAFMVGVPELSAISMFCFMFANCQTRIGHNEKFDARIIRIALKRYPVMDPDMWKAATSECTQRLSTQIMQMAPTDKMMAAGRFHTKSPKLSEAYLHFTGKSLEGAHNALVDVKACMAVYFAIKEMSSGNGGQA